MHDEGDPEEDAPGPGTRGGGDWQRSTREQTAREFSRQESARRANVLTESARETFAFRLAELLRASGLTQQRAAERVQERWPERGTGRVTEQRISDWKNARGLPRPESLRRLVRVLIEAARRQGADPSRLTPGLLDEGAWTRWWRSAEACPARRHNPDSVETRATAVPAEARKVAEVSPLLLGVHRSIEATDTAMDALPLYVLRDTDRDPLGFRARMRKAAQRGGFLVLVGDSSVGKTRTAYEAMLHLLSDWWLLHPRDWAEIDVFSRRIPPGGRVVVWLDELQNYLDGDHGIVAAIRSLLYDDGPVVVIATVQPPFAAPLTAQDSFEPMTADRALLKMAEVVRLGTCLSGDEQVLARTLATSDPRLRAALAVNDHGLVQTLAAAPQLVARWEIADVYAKAVLNAAIDATRLGWESPLPRELLRQAAPGYCDGRTRAAASGDWFETALAYAMTPLNGGVRALAATAPPDGAMGDSLGFILAEYLLQHAGHLRRDEPGPGALWAALAAHVTDPGDLHRLASAAQNRGLPQHVARFLRKGSP